MVIIITVISSLIYLSFQSQSIYGLDAGDLVTASYVAGIAHPPGYPLYTLIGHLLTKLPFFSVAWRISLLSSIPSVLTLIILYLFLNRLINNKYASVTAVLILAFNYVFWLYAIIPEVFALYSFFIVVIIYILLKWHQTKDYKFLLLFSFCYGLALSHHHLILFLLPAISYLFYQDKKKVINYAKANQIKFIFLLLLGLTPYLYIIIRAQFIPEINWGDARNIENFIQLITRARYGTFQAATHTAGLFASRLLQFKIYFTFILRDFGIISLLLMLAGAYFQYRKSKKLFNFVGLAFLFTGPFYFFYASYYITSSFALATYERFLIASYIFLTIWLGYGIVATQYFFSYIFKKYKIIKSQNSINLFNHLLLAVILIIPIGLFITNYHDLLIVKGSKFAENYAKDILNTPEKNAILLIHTDPSIFNSQYIHYVYNYRPDIIIIPVGDLVMNGYKSHLNKYHPKVILPDYYSSKTYLKSFIKANYSKYPIYSYQAYDNISLKGTWIPYGLLFKYYQSKKQIPSNNLIIRKNFSLWQKYHLITENTKIGSNMAFDNYRQQYYAQLLNTIVYHLSIRQYQLAIDYSNIAKKIRSDDNMSYYYQAKALYELKRCNEAKDVLNKSIDINNKYSFNYQLLSVLYKKCYKDNVKAKKYNQLFEKLQENQETKLKEL